MSEFWKRVEDREEGLSDARGCYVFGIRASGGDRITPWYVGRTNRQTFCHECLNPHQRNHYTYALGRYSKATAFMYLVPQMTNKGGFYHGRSGKSIGFLERFLIGLGLRANPELCNKGDTRLYREVVMPGFLNSPRGQQGKATQSLLRTFDV